MKRREEGEGEEERGRVGRMKRREGGEGEEERGRGWSDIVRGHPSDLRDTTHH